MLVLSTLLLLLIAHTNLANLVMIGKIVTIIISTHRTMHYVHAHSFYNAVLEKKNAKISTR